MARVTVVVQSEFGRRVRANANGGTDHGYGNPLLVLGGPVNGRRFYGRWDGLAPEILSPNFGDIPVNTDYRQVLSEIPAFGPPGNSGVGAQSSFGPAQTFVDFSVSARSVRWCWSMASAATPPRC